jgi:hypothetical protein
MQSRDVFLRHTKNIETFTVLNVENALDQKTGLLLPLSNAFNLAMTLEASFHIITTLRGTSTSTTLKAPDELNTPNQRSHQHQERFLAQGDMGKPLQSYFINSHQVR